ncbi:transcription factor MYB1R1-like [Quillaja saponaria]|uniref:Transcription factor MYB1R1-like n=1 Tax=Quillaja saponaria TaxID=32244 RepID=A0AAD7L9H1_QUISA|nr:transcription factor MYB1R1-like [Quillaja saponaria]
MSRTCSQCGNNGHNSRTCTEAAGGGGSGAASGENGIMLFGVRVTEGNAFRKSASMTNLSQYDQPSQDTNADAGYASDDVVHASGRSRERKRGVPWTEEEHKLFLLGLQKVGKGDWRGISRNFVKTRTPTQVASHAQKYFLRRINYNRRRRRSSLFDITTDTFMGSSTIMEEDEFHQETHLNQSYGGIPAGSTFPVKLAQVVVPPVAADENPMTKISSTKPIRPIPILPVPPSTKMANLNLNTTNNPMPLSLKQPTSPPSSDEQPPPAAATHSSAFQAMPVKFSSGGDNIISVA